MLRAPCCSADSGPGEPAEPAGGSAGGAAACGGGTAAPCMVGPACVGPATKLVASGSARCWDTGVDVARGCGSDGSRLSPQLPPARPSVMGQPCGSASGFEPSICTVRLPGCTLCGAACAQQGAECGTAGSLELWLATEGNAPWCPAGSAPTTAAAAAQLRGCLCDRTSLPAGWTVAKKRFRPQVQWPLPANQHIAHSALVSGATYLHPLRMLLANTRPPKLGSSSGPATHAPAAAAGCSLGACSLFSSQRKPRSSRVPLCAPSVWPVAILSPWLALCSPPNQSQN